MTQTTKLSEISTKELLAELYRRKGIIELKAKTQMFDNRIVGHDGEYLKKLLCHDFIKDMKRTSIFDRCVEVDNYTPNGEPTFNGKMYVTLSPKFLDRKNEIS